MTPLRFVIVFLPPVWLIAHVLRRSSMNWPMRLLAVLAIVLISQIHTINAFFFHSLAGPDMPAWLLIPQLWLYVGLLVLFCCVACLDALRLLRWCIGLLSVRPQTTFSSERRSVLRRGTASLACAVAAPAVSLGTSAVAIAQGIAVPGLHEMELALPELPSELDGLRMAHLTDLHIGPLTSAAWVRQVVQLTNSARPDLICLTGDLTDGQLEYQAADGGTRLDAARELGSFAAKYGVFACTGNHEYYSDYHGWMEQYAACGIRVLHNEAVVLRHDTARLVLFGLDDHTGSRFGFPVPADSQTLLAQFPGRGENACRIILVHRPDTAANNAAAGADVQLSGHTHGGQCLGMDRLVAHYNQGLVRGWYRVAGMPLYVSSGAGLWPGYPVRLGIPAEIAVITLRKGLATRMRDGRPQA